MSETKRSNILNPHRIGLAEQKRQEWVVDAEEGTTIADLLEPGYWGHVSAQFQPYDHVEVRLETGEWLAELLVMGVGRNWAKVYLVTKHELQPVEDTPPAIKHKVEWKGPHRKHAVIRVADSEVVQEGFSEKSEAVTWMLNHERVTSVA
jgi:hypothetical protein